MNMPSLPPDGAALPAAALFAAMDATWPAARTVDLAGWRLRVGGGGGRRVSAASEEGQRGDVDAAEAGMRALGQVPLFLIRAGETALDAALAERGYRIDAPVDVLAAPCAALAPPPARDRVVCCDAPLARMCEVWAAGGIGPARRAVMARAAGPRCYLLARARDRIAGAAFVALSDDVAMLHALTIGPEARRLGLGADVTRAAAAWAGEAGAGHLAVLVERDNAAARALYRGLGLTPATGYHYRVHA